MKLLRWFFLLVFLNRDIACFLRKNPLLAIVLIRFHCYFFLYCIYCRLHVSYYLLFQFGLRPKTQDYLNNGKFQLFAYNLSFLNLVFTIRVKIAFDHHCFVRCEITFDVWKHFRCLYKIYVSTWKLNVLIRIIWTDSVRSSTALSLPHPFSRALLWQQLTHLYFIKCDTYKLV